ncbi:MAG: hypothetical protein WD355_07880 [Balneolaceae bacterium]
MDRKPIRTLFLFVLFFLPVQYGLVGLVSLSHSEPWPAFVFPGFKSVYTFESGSYTVPELQFLAWSDESNEPVEISPLELFAGIPRSQSQGFLRSNFADAQQTEELAEDARIWLKRQTETVVPGLSLQRLDIVWVENRYSFEKERGELHETHVTESLSFYFTPEQ